MTSERPEAAEPGSPNSSHRRRRAPSRGAGPGGQGPYLAVAGGVLLGLVIAWWTFRVGAYVMAASMLIGAIFRAVLPAERLGFLVTRKKATDITVMAVLGAGLAILAFAAPHGG